MSIKIQVTYVYIGSRVYPKLKHPLSNKRTSNLCTSWQRRHVNYINKKCQDYGEPNTELPIFFANQKIRLIPATLT